MNSDMVNVYSRLVFSAVLLLITATGFTQFSDTTNYHFSFAGTGNINRTNTGSSYIFNNSVNFDIQKKHLSLNTFNGWVYGENNTTKTNNDFVSTIDVDLFKEIRRLYYWALAGYEKSLSLKINDRIQGGVGVGFHILDKENAKISVTDGVLFEATDFREPDQYGREKYETIRNSFRLKFRFVVRNTFTIEGTDFFQQSFSDGKDYIIRSNTAFTMRVYKWFGVTLGLTYNKLNLTDSENFLLNYGVTMEKYF